MKRTMMLVALMICVVAPAFGQQRIVVEKVSGDIVDVGDATLQYDSRYFDHVDSATNITPEGDDVQKYTRNAAGEIVLRPKEEPVKNFANEWRNELISRINATRMSDDLKTILIEIVKGMRS